MFLFKYITFFSCASCTRKNKKEHQTMKIKLFTREHVSDGIHETLGFEKSRIENDVEFETRINDFMIDKNVVSVQSLKDSVFVTYDD